MAFTVCSLNMNGIRASEKKGFSEWLQRKSPDALCLQEVRAWPEQVGPELISPAGYNSKWVVAEKKGYAGVALYSRDSVDQYKVGSGLEWGDREGRILRADFGNLSVISVYVPSGSSSEERQKAKYEYMDHFAKYSRKLLKEERDILVCGDFNIAHEEIDIHDPKRNAKNSGFLPEEGKWFTKLLKQGWSDTFREQHEGVADLYSWWSNRGRARENNKGWRLDYVLASPSLAKKVNKAWIDNEAGLSDHAPVFVEFDI